MGIATGSLTELNYLLVDDHPLFREGLHRVLSDAGIKKIAEAATGEQALLEVEKSKPDIILMDLYMPGLNGIETTKRVLSRCPATLIIILTVNEDDNTIAEALRAGAHGFLNKSMHSKDIIKSLNSLITGKIPLSKPMTRNMLVHLTAPADGLVCDDPAANQGYNISPREKEILSALALGMSNKEIARKLYISEYTVKNHVRNILEKLQVRSRTQAATKALASGLVKISDSGS